MSKQDRLAATLNDLDVYTEVFPQGVVVYDAQWQGYVYDDEAIEDLIKVVRAEGPDARDHWLDTNEPVEAIEHFDNYDAEYERSKMEALAEDAWEARRGR